VETEANSAGHISWAEDVTRGVAMAGGGKGLAGVLGRCPRDHYLPN
jgi:hypothetical protein